MASLTNERIPILPVSVLIAVAAMLFHPGAVGMEQVLLAIMAISLVAPIFPTGMLAVVIYANVADVATDVYHLPPIGGLLAPGLLVVLLIRAAVGLEDMRPSLRLLPFAVLYLSTHGLSLLWVDQPGPTIDELSNLAKSLLLVLIFVGFLTSMQRLRRTVAYAAIAVALVAAVSDLQYLTGTFNATYGGFANASIKQIAGETESWRLSGPLPDPNFFGQLLVVGLPMVGVFAFIAKSRVVRLLALGFAALVLLATVFTFSRGALLGLAAMVGVSILASRSRMVLLLGLGIVGVAAIVVVPASYLERLVPIWQAVTTILSGGQWIVDPALAERFSVVRAALAMFGSDPIVGIGLGQFPVQFQEFALRSGLDLAAPPEAHSLFLETLAEGGLLNFVLLIAVMAGTILVGLRSHTRLRLIGARDDAILVRGLLLSFVGYMTTAVFLHGAYERFFWLGAALVLSTQFASRMPTATTPPDQNYWSRLMTSEIPLLLDAPRLIWNRKWLIASLTALGVGAGFYNAGNAHRDYAAESTLLYRFGREYFPIAPGEQRREWGENVMISLDNAIFTEMRLLTSDVVFDQARRSLGDAASASLADRDPDKTIFASRVQGAAMVTVSARDADPTTADALLKAQIAEYIKERQRIFDVDPSAFFDNEIATRTAARDELTAQRQGAMTDAAYPALPQDLDDIRAEVARLVALADPTQADALAAAKERAAVLEKVSARITGIDTQTQAIDVELATLNQERANATLTREYRRSVEPVVEQVDWRSAAGNPVGTSPKLQIVLSGIFGLVAGLLIALAAAALARMNPVPVDDPVPPFEPPRNRVKH